MSKEKKYNIVSWIAVFFAITFMAGAAYFLFKEFSPITALLFSAISMLFTEVGRMLDRKYRTLKMERKDREFFDYPDMIDSKQNEFDHE